MPQNKKQHFVPKVLLEHFASDDAGRQINVMNIGLARVIRKASLRDQCQKPHFYGKDGVVEKNLAVLEGVLGQIIDQVKTSNTFPLDAMFRCKIALQLALQQARTTVAEVKLNSAVEKFTKLLMSGQFTAEQLQGVKISLNNASAMNIGRAMLAAPIMYDLKLFLILNKARMPFIISDNPVVTTNYFCLQKFPSRPSMGTSKSGFQITMPLTPRHAVLMHDRYVYETRANGNVIVVERDSEVSALNRVQWENALANVYFSDAFDERAINDCLSWDRSANKELRLTRFSPVDHDPGAFVASDKSIYDAPDSGVDRELVLISDAPPKTAIRMSAIRIRSKPRYFDEGSAADPLRDPAWREIVKAFSASSEPKARDFNRLWAFAVSHPLFSEVGPEIRNVERAFRIKR